MIILSFTKDIQNIHISKATLIALSVDTPPFTTIRHKKYTPPYNKQFLLFKLSTIRGAYQNISPGYFPFLTLRSAKILGISFSNPLKKNKHMVTSIELSACNHIKVNSIALNAAAVCTAAPPT
ncbi:hypothetical protein DES36_12431 [Alkalibaculum bacchi]|uniref:Uncharacterized protein n=1 Tax=Alkalibaculum bacchi TaxID=645887 RepID=A0A366HYY5_9FIRM|nr:hypothetical protein DES36_12431 [Alkalibaculum bacchi]